MRRSTFCIFVTFFVAYLYVLCVSSESEHTIELRTTNRPTSKRKISAFSSTTHVMCLSQRIPDKLDTCCYKSSDLLIEHDLNVAATVTFGLVCSEQPFNHITLTKRPYQNRMCSHKLVTPRKYVFRISHEEQR